MRERADFSFQAQSSHPVYATNKMSDRGSNDSQSSQPQVRHQPTTDSEMPLPSIERDWPLLTAEEQIAIQESNQRARERLPELQRWLRNVERDVAAQRANGERELGMSI